MNLRGETTSQNIIREEARPTSTQSQAKEKARDEGRR